MLSYRDDGVEKLQDCQVSVDFCKLVNELSDVMNTNTPINALKPDSKQYEVSIQINKEV